MDHFEFDYTVSGENLIMAGVVIVLGQVMALFSQLRCQLFMRKYQAALGKQFGRTTNYFFYPQLITCAFSVCLCLWSLAFCGFIELGLVVVALLLIAFYVIDCLKFTVLKEPLVWSDFYLIREIALCPELYFSYIGRGWWIGITVGTVVIITALALMPLYTEIPITIRIGLSVTALVLTYAVNLCVRLKMGRQKLYYDALYDGSRLGPVYALLQQLLTKGQADRFIQEHGLQAYLEYHEFAENKRMARLRKLREEQEEERIKKEKAQGKARGKRPRVPRIMHVDELMAMKTDPQSVVLIQAESFCNLKRFELAEDNISLVKSRKIRGLGLLDIDYLGAYTMRTEFAVLTGIRPSHLGVYAYNPYLMAYRFKFKSIARTLKEKGFTTICVHPNHRQFFSRYRVIENLGFDRFIDISELQKLKRDGKYVSDEALLGYVGDLLKQHEGKKVFVFVITMEAHGPWDRKYYPSLFANRPVGHYGSELNRNTEHDMRVEPADADRLKIYEHHLLSLDKGINKLMKKLKKDDMMVVYGDHLPAIGAIHSRGLALYPNLPSLKPDVYAYNIRDNIAHTDDNDLHEISYSQKLICYNLLSLSTLHQVLARLKR